MGDAHALTQFDYRPSFVWIEDAGKYRRPLAGRAAGLLKPRKRCVHPPVVDGHPNFGPSMSGTSDVAISCIRARSFSHDVTGCRLRPVRRTA